MKKTKFTTLLITLFLALSFYNCEESGEIQFDVIDDFKGEQIEIMNARSKLHNFVCKFEFSSIEKIDEKFERMKDQKIVYYRVKSPENREENDKYCLDKLLDKCYHL